MASSEAVVVWLLWGYTTAILLCLFKENKMSDKPSAHQQAVQAHRAAMAQLRIHPFDRVGVDGLDGFTMVTCTSPSYGTDVYYLSIDEYSTHISAIIDGMLWCNGYTFLIQPMRF